MTLLIKTQGSRSLFVYGCGVLVVMMVVYSIFSTLSIKIDKYGINSYFITERELSSIYDIRRASNTTTHKNSAKNNTIEAKNNTVEGGLGSEGTNVNKVSLVFVTASSANHMLALLLDHLPSIEKWVLNTTTPTFLPTLEGESSPTKADLSVRVIHYNLDPVEKRALKENQANMQELRNKFPYVELREFDYAAHPSYFNIEIAAGEYAFKPVIVEQVARELQNMDADNAFGTTSNNGYGYAQSYLYWLDAGARIGDGGCPFQQDFQIAKKQGIYTPVSAGSLKRWTVQGTADYLKLDHEIYVSPETRICSGNMILLDIKNQTIYDRVIKPWMTCARVEECIAPEGSSRTNHRQDQSALSVILNKSNINISDRTGSITRGRQ